MTASPFSGSPRSPRPADHWIEYLRIGLGAIWLANLVFVVDPANQFFASFATTAQSYGPSTPAILGGSSLANLVAAHTGLFAALIALATGYLAVAFLLGVTVRPALVVGTVFTTLLLVTQWGQTFVFPGGTDVGPMPLYLLMYGILWVGGAGTYLTLRQPRLARLSRVTGSAPVP
jgi:hypothetical protein